MLLKNYRASRPCPAFPSRDDLYGADCVIAGPKRRAAIRHLAAVKARKESLTGNSENYHISRDDYRYVR